MCLTWNLWEHLCNIWNVTSIGRIYLIPHNSQQSFEICPMTFWKCSHHMVSGNISAHLPNYHTAYSTSTCSTGSDSSQQPPQSYQLSNTHTLLLSVFHPSLRVFCFHRATILRPGIRPRPHSDMSSVPSHSAWVPVNPANPPATFSCWFQS